MKISHRTILTVILSGSFLLAGCSSIVKRSVDTQPIVEIQETDYENPDIIVEGSAVFYEPLLSSGLSLEDADLIRFSPVIVQGFQSAGPDGKNTYDYWQDGIGSPKLVNKGRQVQIDTKKPTLFCRVEQAQVHGQKLKQLVYVWWYPSRPVGTIEKGQVDGNILRITLDNKGNPIVFEYSQTCGCYHGVFASMQLERLAADEFAEPLEGKRYALENIQVDKTDWVIRDLIKVQPDQKLFVFVSVGKHFGKAMRFMEADALKDRNRESYSLAEYESLVRISTDEGGTASMFNDEGLVKGAKRSGEEIMLADLDHPGWPRHLDRMLIHWDQDRWSDPMLIAEALRVPRKAVADSPDAPLKKTAKTEPEHLDKRIAPSELPAVILNSYPHDKAFLVMVSHRYCLGCEAFKKKVLPLPDVQKELSKWNFVSLDMFKKEQMMIAKPMNITLTPTVICYDKEGHELRRIEGVDSKEQLLKFIAG